MKKIITAIHVDDDPNSLQRMREVAETIPNLWLKESFDNSEAAIRYLDEHEVNIVFTDIEMPDKGGFWLASQLDSRQDIVFVTAFTDYAVNAFEACALDYIIKPLQRDRLQKVVDRYDEKHERYALVDQINELLHNYMEPNAYPRRIFINFTGHMRVVQLEDVLYFAASGSYSKVHFKSGEILLSSKLMKTYTEVLNNHPDFVRIHRSHLVNKNYVNMLNRDISKFSVTMTNGDVLDVSQKRKDEIFDLLTR